MAAKKAAGGGSSGLSGFANRKISGVVLIAGQGQGFVGDSMTAKERLFFHFRDVVGNKGHELKQGTRVAYKSRTNDSTLEKEAYEIELEGGGGKGGAWGADRRGDAGGSSRGRHGMGRGGRGGGAGGGAGGRAGGGGGGGGAWAPSFRSSRDAAGSEGSTASSAGPSSSASAASKKAAIKEAAARVNNATQRSGNNRDQFGREQQFNAGALLSIVGLEGEDGAVAKNSKSPDDWHPQMERWVLEWRGGGGGGERGGGGGGGEGGCACAT